MKIMLGLSRSPVTRPATGAVPPTQCRVPAMASWMTDRGSNRSRASMSCILSHRKPEPGQPGWSLLASSPRLPAVPVFGQRRAQPVSLATSLQKPLSCSPPTGALIGLAAWVGCAAPYHSTHRQQSLPGGSVERFYRPRPCVNNFGAPPNMAWRWQRLGCDEVAFASAASPRPWRPEFPKARSVRVCSRPKQVATRNRLASALALNRQEKSPLPIR